VGTRRGRPSAAGRHGCEVHLLESDAMSRHWRFHVHDRGVVGHLVRRLGCSALVAQVLAARGVTTDEEAKRFLSAKLTDLHDPGLMPGATEAAERIVAAIQAGRRVTIYGDYDVDGVTATSILYNCVRLAGGNADYYIPNRLEEGYGLNAEAIRKLHEEDPQRLVVTVDCGICSTHEAALARALGLELIITDHHTFTPELPDAACLVHPRLPGGSYPFGELCGAGVAFKLAWAVCQRMGDGKKASAPMREFLISAVGLAAIGTVADVVPLVDENRILVHNGLMSLASRAPLGLQTLMKVSGVEPREALCSEDIGFALAPRLNAAGRLGQARLAVELLTTSDTERAQQLAAYVDQLNKNRQTVERRMLKQAKELVAEHGWHEQSALVLAHAEWHPGVIGIVAGRVAEHYSRPAVLIALDEANGCGQGSGRTFGGYDLYSALAACHSHLLGFGGHRAAAGLRISSTSIDHFRASFSAHVAETHAVEAAEVELPIDAEVSLADLTLPAVKELEKLGPFGCEHARPVFATTNVTLAGAPQTMGEGRHLSIRIKQGRDVLRAIAFGRGEWADEMAAVEGPISVCYKATINRFRGRESVDLHLIDWQPETKAAPSRNPEVSPMVGSG
jgi:single-stranded-DNA-specific exonuclease